jgi:hypothetical protein
MAIYVCWMKVVGGETGDGAGLGMCLGIRDVLSSSTLVWGIVLGMVGRGWSADGYEFCQVSMKSLVSTFSYTLP